MDDNTINVSSEVSGTYTLVYEGADGQPLDDYAQICSLNVTNTASYFDFIDVDVAPRSTKVIGAYGAANDRATTSGIDATRWENYTGRPLVFEYSVENSGKVDHFLFFGMSIWNFSNAYSAQSMAWLESKL